MTNEQDMIYNASRQKDINVRQDEKNRGVPVLGFFVRVPGMAQVLRVKVPSRVFTAKCSEPQAEDSNV